MSPTYEHSVAQRALQLLLDLGSSRNKWLLLTDDEPLSSAELGTGSLADLRRALHTRLASGCQLQAAIGICVAGNDRRDPLSAMLLTEYDVVVHWLATRSRVGDLRCAYADPRQLGVDRWAGLAGARASYADEHVVMVDCGTATTVDFLAADGQHLGGWISPGLGDSLHTLLQRLGHLPALTDCRADELLRQLPISSAAASANADGYARDTRSALLQGVLHSQIAIIEHAQQQAVRSGWQSFRLLLTGGDAERLLPLLAIDAGSIHAEWQPLLLFAGMQWLQQQA